jgi:hypothetical protein
MKNIIIRVSKINRSLILSMNPEGVYRVHINGVESFNGLNYDTASNHYNFLEANIYQN